MRWFLMVPLLLGLAGLGLLIYSARLPVYTDSRAPDRLTQQLDHLPPETRSAEWYARLHTFETPHKKLSDWGRGLLAAAVGMASASVLLAQYHRWDWVRQRWIIFALWLGLWAVRIPFSMWYYGVREERFDYPVWADSIAIPICQESLAWICGGVISSIVLGMLLHRHSLPTRIGLVRPRSAFGWFRATFLTLWLFALLFFAVSGVPEGDEGMTFSCLVASAILVIFLCASEAEPVRGPAPDIQPMEA